VAVVFGIDVSHFQHGLSLAAVNAQGYEFVIAKATQGQGVQDADFHTFREEAQSLGLLFAGLPLPALGQLRARAGGQSGRASDRAHQHPGDDRLRTV
jgi:hypothetical protein